jgi:hypothetical protein
MSFVSFISIPIRPKLRLPELAVGFRYGRVFATTMLMPETSMNENNGTKFWKNDVGAAWEVLYMEAITETLRVQKPSHQHFRGSVLPFDASHHPAARRLVDDVSHHASSLSPEAFMNTG